MTDNTTSHTIPDLCFENWDEWKAKVKGLLLSKGLAGALSDEESEHSDRAIGYMLQFCGPDYIEIIESADNAAVAWETLTEQFQQSTAANCLRLLEDFNTLEQGASETVAQYLSRAGKICSQLAATGKSIDSDMKVSRILIGLRSDFSTIAAVIRNNDVLPSLTDLRAKLLVEEKLLPQTRLLRDTAFAAAVRGKGSTKPANVPRKNMWQRKDEIDGSDSDSSDSEGEDVMRCWWCGSTEHIKKLLDGHCLSSVLSTSATCASRRRQRCQRRLSTSEKE